MKSNRAIQLGYQEVWAVDFEFTARPGERPVPICLVATELLSGRTIRLFGDDLRSRREPPYRTDADTLVIAYYASAEIGCHLALGWPVPVNILDPFAEFRVTTNGRRPPGNNGMLGALAWYGLGGMASAAKAEQRELAIRGGPFTVAEMSDLLTYCEADVRALVSLTEAMLPSLDPPRAYLRGRYMAAAARIEWVGVPISGTRLARLRTHWPAVQERLIAEVDRAYGVFEGRRFCSRRWAEWLKQHHVAWPQTAAGQLALDDDTFREMARSHPSVAPMRELRATLGKMRLSGLSVGHDHRNRVLLSAFAARTGRNQPSTTQFIFGPAVWVRGLIQPEDGWTLVYIDWSQQEFGIAAALSSDPQMLAAYESGDSYLAFAKQAGLVPPDATKESHAARRELAKACVLAVQYGMGPAALARRLGTSTAVAHELLDLHRKTYTKFWQWSDSAVDYTLQSGSIHTVYGWRYYLQGRASEPSIRNFPMQANGAEMLRLACCLATEAGHRICAPVHDALLIEARSADLEKEVAAVSDAMSDASAAVLGGFRLRSDVKMIRYPDRYVDPRGEHMWDTVWRVVEGIEASEGGVVECA